MHGDLSLSLTIDCFVQVRRFGWPTDAPDTGFLRDLSWAEPDTDASHRVQDIFKSLRCPRRSHGGVRRDLKRRVSYCDGDLCCCGVKRFRFECRKSGMIDHPTLRCCPSWPGTVQLTKTTSTALLSHMAFPRALHCHAQRCIHRLYIHSAHVPHNPTTLPLQRHLHLLILTTFRLHSSLRLVQRLAPAHGSHSANFGVPELPDGAQLHACSSVVSFTERSSVERRPSFTRARQV